MKISDVIFCQNAKPADFGSSNLFGVTRNFILPNIPGTISVMFYLTFELVQDDEPFKLAIEVITKEHELVGHFEHDIGLPPALDSEFNVMTIAQPVTIRVAIVGIYSAHISINGKRVVSKTITIATPNTNKQRRIVH